MRDFTQANLDAHLAELSQTLTPEQAARVKERVHQRVSSSNLDLSPEAVDGAFQLIGAIVPASDLGAVGERLAGIVSALDPRNLPGASADAISGLFGGLGRLMGGAADLGGTAVGGFGKLLGGAGDLGSGAAGAVGDLAGNAPEVIGAIGGLLESAPDAGEAAGALAGFVVEALGEVLSGNW
jgi:hypothetical protein